MNTKVVLILGQVISMALLAACARSNPLTPLSQVMMAANDSSQVNVNFCTDPSTPQNLLMKTVIILDHSGSNQQNYLMSADGSGVPDMTGGTITIDTKFATDPTGKTRYGSVTTPGTLLNYLSTLPANDPAHPQRYFALVDFNESAVTYPANSSGFTSDINTFFNYVQTDAAHSGGAPQDGGATSYLSALNATQALINADIQLAANCDALPLGSPSPGAWCPTPGKAIPSYYSIIFMSDGAPITNISGIGVNNLGQVVVTGQIQISKESTTDILGKVGALASLGSNSHFVAGVNFFSIYYYYPGNIDLTGQSLLQQMAKVGGGLFYNALSGSNIDYNQFQPPSRLIKYSLSDVIVTNASTIWWTDGKLHADTDMDGLPDDIEKPWGSDGALADTNGNGVSDLVEYRLTNAKACTTRNAKGICIDAATNYGGGACSGVPRSAVPGRPGAIQFQKSDPDGFNDCEKILLNDVAGIKNPDSNGDILPDWLEFINGIAFQTGSISASSPINQDNYTNYQKIKLSLPLSISTTQYMNLQPAQYHLQMVSTNSVQDCYNLTVNGLPVIGDGNTVRVDIIERTQLLQDNYIYRVGRKAFPSGSHSVTFADWNNASEKAANTWSVWP